MCTYDYQLIEQNTQETCISTKVTEHYIAIVNGNDED